MNKSICITGLLVLVVLAMDLSVKYWVIANFKLGETWAIFPSLNLHYTRNYGAAFSFLADKNGWQRWFFAGIAIISVVTLSAIIYQNRARKKLSNIAYAIIISGALGNLFDRMWYGFVIDYIDFYIGDWHFATFNLADTVICSGAGLIMLERFWITRNISMKKKG